MQAIILAGGLGTRLREVVADVPKPMAPINGRPFLAYQLDYWIDQGIKSFIISIGYKSSSIRDYFKSEYRHIPVTYAVEEQPLGTGGGFLLAAAKLMGSEPFLVLNGDTFFEVDLPQFTQFHAAKHADISMALFPIEANNRYMGVEVDKTDKITHLKSSNARTLINGGVYLMEPSSLNGITWKAGDKLSLEDDLFPEILKKGKQFYGFSSKTRFIDIGVPEDFFRAATFLGINK